VTVTSRRGVRPGPTVVAHGRREACRSQNVVADDTKPCSSANAVKERLSIASTMQSRDRGAISR
jgi:hypothetical protein